MGSKRSAQEAALEAARERSKKSKEQQQQGWFELKVGRGKWRRAWLRREDPCPVGSPPCCSSARRACLEHGPPPLCPAPRRSTPTCT